MTPEKFEKNFDGWNTQKRSLDALETVPDFKAREVWWCSIGANIGSEMCGKGATFTRPVLILRKTGPTTFLGVPATTSMTARFDHFPVRIKGRSGNLRLFGIRSYDARRLADRMGRLPEIEFAAVQKAIIEKIFSPPS
jgi:mRNA interferase MazF